MTITQEKIDNLLTKVKVSLAKEDYEPEVKKQIKQLSKQVQVKGFRPGMVPLDLVKKMYGNSVLADELNKKLNDEVYKYIGDNKLDIIASPIPVEGQKLDIDINNIQDVNFDYELANAPAVDLSYLETAPAFTKHKITVEDSMIDEEIMRTRRQFATYEYPDTIEEKDTLSFSIEELNADGSIKEGGISTVSSVSAELMKDDMKQIVMAMKKQDVITANVFDIMDREKEAIAKNILNMTDLSQLDSVSDKFQFTLNNITRSKPAEINEEFFVKVYGENGIKSEADMRANIKADLETFFDGRTDTLLINDIYKTIIENANFPLPETFLKRWIKLTNEKEISEEEIERDFPQFAKSLCWNLVQRKVVTENDIKITQEEVTERVRMQVIQQLYGYGLKNIGEEWVEQFIQKQLSDRKNVEQTREQLLEDKVLAYIKSKVKLNETPISFEAFKVMVEAQNA